MLTIAALVVALLWLPSPWNVAVVGTAALVDLAETVVFVRWSKRRRAAVGLETLVGRRAVVVTALAPRGQVRVDGEIWQACSPRAAADPGADVVVRAVDGLTLEVDPEAQPTYPRVETPQSPGAEHVP